MYRVIDCNKYSPRGQDVDCRRSCVCVGIGDIHENSLCIPPNFAINLKLYFFKNSNFKNKCISDW